MKTIPSEDIDDFTKDNQFSTQPNESNQKYCLIKIKKSNLTFFICILITIIIFIAKIEHENINQFQVKCNRQLTRLHQKIVNDIQIPQALPEYNQLTDPYSESRLSSTRHEYPTIGCPVPGNTFNSTFVQKKDLNIFDQQMIDLLKPYNDTDCEFQVYGYLGFDGSYVACQNIFQHSEALINIGINGFDQAGCDITSDFDMVNYQYDCTNPTKTVCDTNKNSNVFNFACVGQFTEKTQNHIFFTLEDVLRRHNLTNKHVSIKIDCEGCEWQTFKNFPLESLQYVDQIIGQFHFREISPQVWGNLDIIRSIMKYFVVVNFHSPDFLCIPEQRSFRRLPSKTLELVFVNKRLINLRSNSRSFDYNYFKNMSCPPPDEQAGSRENLINTFHATSDEKLNKSN